MTRLIDADALLEELKSFLSYSTKLLKNHGYSDAVEFVESYHSDMEILITNAPTVQREGWVSVPIEPTREMLDAGHKDLTRDFGIDSMLKVAYKAMIQAAPTDKE